jgi:hypothetical protein
MMATVGDDELTETRMPQRVLALVDSSPVLLLPSILACRERAGRSLAVTLAGPLQAEQAMRRLITVLARHGIVGAIQEREPTLEETISAWLRTIPTGEPPPLVDVSSASGGTAARAVLATRREGRETRLCWFNETHNEVHFSAGEVLEAQTIDIGSSRSVQSAIRPSDFMAIFGLERTLDDPYCGVPASRLVPSAMQVLELAVAHEDDYRQLRRLLGAARAHTNWHLAAEAIPSTVHPLLAGLSELDGWIHTAGVDIVLGGTRDTNAVFFLSGGWLEVLVSEAITRALPDHQVQLNCGTTWGRKRRAEAEMDVAFVYHNALYLLSCKNDHLTERFFPHLDRFRALTAEFGESRTRPVLLSTAALEPRLIRRCDAYEIGQISGAPLLDLLQRSLAGEPKALLEGLVTVGRGAPRAGVA